MSPLGSIDELRNYVQNNLIEAIPTKWWLQFSFGMEAFALRPFQSAGSNARAVVENTNTAASKMLRLLANHKLAAQLGTVFDEMNLVRPSSYVNIDHSDFNGLTALVGAVQTRNGRAIPCMVETTYALHIPAAGSQHDSPRWRRLRTDMQFCRAQQGFTGHTIDALQTMADRLGFWPKLVFDRGFANESIVEHLHSQGATFYIRLKGGRYVSCDGKQAKIAQLKEKDATVEVFGMTLRVIRSPKSRRSPQPWYILTNDTVSSRAKIVRIYYHRFEIEETFKDTKHLFELHRLQFNRVTSLKIVLWLVFLGIGLLYVTTRPAKSRRTDHPPKKWRSWIRTAYETLQRQLTGLRALTGLTPPQCVRGQV